ncbi:MalY/PatB family protein [Williamsoniiplasma lucivorax]|uniref:cysteine-S-conjugate beta-lyase n=1 Tax=Williamsoniiplasma lucivorax TaxID=209274 RepID=A0A2S5RF82_9MOLU|nr:aminotransferase class I/II-fold pyridoxal phosphate-dependent enzyme [Williamsoniiplasma lucivorax]PPE05971.1 cystathione beta-lyase [Williamsoniiplasma lucivorax]
MDNIFDKKIDRSNHEEKKWSLEHLKRTFPVNFSKKLHSLWIADLDFETPKPIVDAIKTRANKATYSYGYIQNEAIEAIVLWYKKLHNITLDKSMIQIVDGIVNSMIEVIKCFTKEGESVLIQTPVYKPFEEVILNTKRKLVANKLVHKNNEYHIDFDDFEKQIVDHKVKLFLWCNPHNPGGRVWRDDEVLKIIEICNKHNVFILSDEVHGDLVLKGEHNSILRFADKVKEFIVVNSPNKGFNLAGLYGSYMIFSSQKTMDLVMNTYKQSRVMTPNVFFQPALIAAYANDESFKWFKAMKNYIHDNYLFIKEEFTKLGFLEPMNVEASYLIWTKINLDLDWVALKKELFNHGVIVSFFDSFMGAEPGWFRVNIGLPRAELAQGIEEIKAVLTEFKNR